MIYMYMPCDMRVALLINLDDRIKQGIDTLAEIYLNGEKLGDNIMANALTVMQSVSKTEKLYLKQMSDTSVKLSEFSRSLDNYYASKM